MKKLKILSLVVCAALLFGSTTASASNGDTKIDKPTAPVHIFDTDMSDDAITDVQNLEDIHFGNSGIEPNSIIGDDNLVKISSTTNFPYNVICKIKAYWYLDDNKDEVGEGTGFLIAPDILITVGHCLFERGLGFCNEVEVIPAQSGTMKPYGVYYGDKAIVSYGWYQYEALNDDWGVLKLKKPVVGWLTKFLSFDTETLESEDSLDTISISVAGYPFELPENIKYGDYMWRSRGTVQMFEEKKIFYDCDTVKGTSGAPVMTHLNKVVAINVHSPYSIYEYNSGIRVTQDLIDDIYSSIAKLD